MKLYKEADVNRKECGEIIDKIGGKGTIRNEISTHCNSW